MKKLNLITILLAVFIVLMGCKKECAFVYSGWTSCSNNIQTRTYTSSPSGCTGTPPVDSLQRSCVILPTIPTVIIGTQTWALKNLDIATYRNGDPIPEVQDKTAWANLTTGAWCYYENNTANGTSYGKLYNWYAVNDARGLAPNGFHIPTDAEWTILTNYLGGELQAGSKMKSTTGWNNNGNGTNTSGFAGLPGGFRNDGGEFLNIGVNGCWWSSSENLTSSSWCWYRVLFYYNGNINRYSNLKPYGLSVRCLKD